jgi:transposase
MAQLRDLLGKLEGAPDRVAVAIETPRGAIVESLLERQFPVFSLNPKQMDRFRDRHTVAGAKDDRRDAFVQADSLRTDQRLFRKVRPGQEALIRLRELSRTEEDLKHDQQRAQNRLGDLLNRYFPQLLELSPAADEPWLWELLEKAPLPATAAQKPLRCWTRLLRRNRIRRFDAQALWQKLQAAPLPLSPGSAEALIEHVRVLLPALHLLHRQNQDVAKRIADLLEEIAEEPQSESTQPESTQPESTQPKSTQHRDAQILLSLPGVGRVVGATMLAEANQALEKRDYHALRSLAGCAPVTRQSGQKKFVVMRRACNMRLRQALYYWAMSSLQTDPRSKQYYAALRSKGHSHARALRSLADRLLAMLIAMLRSGTTYDPARRNAAQPADVQPVAA